MNVKRLPADVAVLLAFIGKTEVGKPDPEAYDVIFGQRQSKLKKPVTKMTIAEVQANQNNWGNKTWVRSNWGFQTASSATGKYQFMRATLADIVTNLKLDKNRKFDADLQDDLGWYLLRKRGLDEWRFGRIDDVEFAKRLAQEWASFPVLKNTRGAHRNIKRGDSYYKGDELNKALVKPEAIEKLLRDARAAREAEGGKNAPATPKSGPSATDVAIGVGAGAGGAAVAVEAVPDAPDQLETILEHVGMFGASGSQVMATIGAVLIIVVTGVIIWRIMKRK